MAESADALDSGSSRGNSVEVQVLLSAPNQKESLWRLFLILQVILRGLEPGKVSAFGKCAGGTFSAGSARAVPHAKRGVSRAGSMQGAAAADGQVLLSAPNQKESLWRLFLILQVILRGLEPGKVSAFGKCAGGTFSAGSARAVPHAKRGVTRAESLQGAAAADGQVLLSAPKNSPHFCVGCFFVKTALHLFVIFFTIFRFYYCKMDFNGL